MKNGIILEEWVEVICPAFGSTIGQDFWSNLYYCGFQQTFLNNLYKCQSHWLEWPSTGLSDPAPTSAPSKKPRSGILWMGWRGRANKQSPMHRSVHWTGCVFSPDGVHHSLFLFAASHCTFFFFFFWGS
jgi:hypothetical protein